MQNSLLDEDENGDIPQMKYCQRSGTSDSGRDYELKILTLIALRCATQDFEDFWLAANVNKIGDFDDVILQIKRPSQGIRLTYMLQLKHSSKAKNITKNEFESEKGDFAIRKYDRGFSELKSTLKSTFLDDVIKHVDVQNTLFVFFTNRNICNKSKEVLEGARSDEYKFLEITQDKRLAFLNTSAEAKYKFNFDHFEGSGSLENLDYCHNIFLLVNQVDVEKLQNLIVNEVEEFIKHFGLKNNKLEIIVAKFEIYIKNWVGGKFGCNFYLTKRHVLKKLTELFLSLYEVDVSREIFIWYDSEVKTVWNKIIRDKSVVVVNSDRIVLDFLKQYVGSEVRNYFDQTNKSWSYKLSGEEKSSFYQKHEVLKKSMLSIVTKYGDIKILDIYKCLWLHGKVPLLLKIDTNEDYEDIMQILKFPFSLKVIIINEKTIFAKLTSTTIFATLQDLNSSERNEILKQPVTLQGRPSSLLQDLVTNEMYQFIKTNEIIYILLNCFNIGNTYSDVSEYFINRSLSKVLFDEKIFEQIQDELFLVEYATNHCSVKERDNVIICSEDEWKKLKKKRKKIIHRFKAHDGFYEWMETFGSIKNIREYHDLYINVQPMADTFWVPLQDKLKSNNLLRKTLIIQGNPGMGKTTLVDFVSQQVPNNIWALKVNLSEHNDYLEEMKNDIREIRADECLHHFNNVIIRKCSNFDLAQLVFKKLLNENRILLLVDGFDEIPISFRKEATKILTSVHKSGYPMWVTTRPIMKAHLEEQLNTISVTLKPFIKDDQFDYLVNNFSIICNDIVTNEEINKDLLIERFSEKVLHAAKFNFNDSDLEFTGIPLQVKLLAEVFGDDCKKCVESGKIVFNKSFDLLYLYKEFIGKKNEIFYQKYGKTSITIDMRCNLERHQRLFALKHIFDKKILNEPKIDRELIDYKNDQSKLYDLQRSGVLVVEESEAPCIRFIHRTYAEYFAAEWLFLNLKTNYKKNVIKLMKTRFAESNFLEFDGYDFLFTLFDQMVAKNSRLHVALINNRVEEASEIIKSDAASANVLDECGRSVVHIAALYSVHHPFDSFWFDFVPVTDNLVCVIDLIPKGSVWNETDLLGYSPFDCALAKNTLDVAEKICEKTNITGLKKPLSMSSIHVYFQQCIHLNYKSLFMLFLTHFSYRDILLRSAYLNTSIYDYCIRKCGQDPSHGKLHEFIKLYNMDTLLQIHSSNFGPINELDELHHSAAFYSKRDVKFLVKEKKFGINVEDIEGNTPFHYAIIHERWKIVKFFKENGADIRKRGKDNNTPLHFAVITRNPVWVKHILGSLKPGINSKNSYKQTPLHLAVHGNSLKIVKILLNRKANVDVKDIMGFTPLHYAAENGFNNIVETLLGAVKNNSLQQSDGGNIIPLHVAAKTGNEKTVDLFLSSGVSCNVKDQIGKTALHYAAMGNNFQVVSFLLSKNAQTNKDIEGNTPLHLALMHNRTESANILLSKSADVNLQNSSGNSLLHYAVLTGNAEIVQNILSIQGVDINIKNDKDDTPLNFLISSDNFTLDVAELLLSKGADCNIRNKSQLSALHSAAYCFQPGAVIIIEHPFGVSPNRNIEESVNKRMSLIKLLLKYGADYNLQDNKGNTLLHWITDLTNTKLFYCLLLNEENKMCLFKFYEDIVTLLVSLNADINIKNNDGKTSIKLAEETGYVKILSILQRQNDAVNDIV